MINFLKLAALHGFTEVRPGVFLCSSTLMQKEQKDWYEDDLSKNVDFSSYKYWLHSDGFLEGINNAKDLSMYLGE